MSASRWVPAAAAHTEPISEPTSRLTDEDYTVSAENYHRGIPRKKGQLYGQINSLWSTGQKMWYNLAMSKLSQKADSILAVHFVDLLQADRISAKNVHQICFKSSHFCNENGFTQRERECMYRGNVRSVAQLVAPRTPSSECPAPCSKRCGTRYLTRALQ